MLNVTPRRGFVDFEFVFIMLVRFRQFRQCAQGGQPGRPASFSRHEFANDFASQGAELVFFALHFANQCHEP